MKIKKVPISLLKTKTYTRLQCMLGCLHYKRNPMCPPSCQKTVWFERLIASYQHANIYFENIEFNDRFDLIEKRKLFQTRLLEEEHRLKLEGNFYALCLFSGECSMCDDKICNLNECRRPFHGRVPVCATGIDIMKLCEEVLGLSKEQSISYWKPLLSKNHFKKFDNKHLCLGIILY